VHVVLGPDSLLAERALGRLLEQELGSDAGDAVQIMRGEESGWARVLDAARSRSLFATRRAVVVRNAEALKGAEDDLVRYLEDPNPDVVLVLLAAKPDKRRSAWKRLVERAQIHTADPLKGRALRTFVVEELRARRLLLAEDAVNELIERVGQDLRRLVGEIDKLQAFAAPSQKLTADDVAAVLGRGLARPFYKLGDLLWERRTVELLELTQELLDDGESGILLLSALHRALRQVALARGLVEQRTPRDQIVARTRVLPFKVGDLLEAARRWSEADLRRLLRALGEADRRMKTGADAGLALTAAISVAGGGKSGGAKPAPQPFR
jgi:DNA polymerase III subunit delta